MRLELRVIARQRRRARQRLRWRAKLRMGRWMRVGLWVSKLATSPSALPSCRE